MIYMSPEFKSRIDSNIFTKSNGNNISNRSIISRPSIPLVNSKFIQYQKIFDSESSSVSIAVEHPYFHKPDTKIYITYVYNNELHLISSKFNVNMNRHAWIKERFHRSASEACITFDGTMPSNKEGIFEFVTRGLPWIFWVDNTTLYANNGKEDIVLAEHGVTSVSSVRATWDEKYLNDFGLIVFFIQNGKIYYRQLIKNEWKDAELVRFGPEVEWVSVTASRTWDYRIVLQAVSSDGNMYEIFTEFMGLGKHCSDYLNIKNASMNYDLAKINKYKRYDSEYVNIADIALPTKFGYLLNTKNPDIVSIRNSPDEHNNYGKIVNVVFDIPIDLSSITGNEFNFSIVDSRGVEFKSIDFEMVDAYNGAVYFQDFNNAKGECRLNYSNGTLTTYAGTISESFFAIFIPENLVPKVPIPPKIVYIKNTDSNANKFIAKFDKGIMDIGANDVANYTFKYKEYDYTPGGVLIDKSANLFAISKGHVDDEVIYELKTGNVNTLQNAVGKVIFEYDGKGHIQGYDGYIKAFSIEFYVENPERKENKKIEENIEIDSINIKKRFVIVNKIKNEENENITIPRINVTYDLKNIKDI